jgi:hypothetical protein
MGGGLVVILSFILFVPCLPIVSVFFRDQGALGNPPFSQVSTPTFLLVC